MASARDFEKRLDHLFRQYTEGLRREVGKSARGPIPKLPKNRLSKRIDKLVKIAFELELKENGKATFQDNYSSKRQWHIKRGKGWGLATKKKTFGDWYASEIGSRNCVYVFWQGRRCLYVGRTGSGGRRPQAHFEKHWIGKATRVDIYMMDGKRKLPMLECLAVHLFRPRYNKVKSAQQKWRSSCPVCAKEVEVRSKLNAIFTRRQKRKK